MKQLLHTLSLVGAWAYVIEGALVFAEDALFFGFFLPGETLVVFCGFLAQQHILSAPVVFLVAAASAVLGDQVGFTLGRRFGPSIRHSVLGRRMPADSWDTAESVISERGAFAVFVGRWVAVLRALVPTTSGALGMSRARFTLWNVVGGVLWALVWTSVGYIAGASWEKAAARIGEVSAAVALVVLAVVLIASLKRARGGAHR